MEFIAAGGFGVVYKAFNFIDNMEYAIKKILIGYFFVNFGVLSSYFSPLTGNLNILISRPKSAAKILREVHLLSQLHHPNIVAYKSAWLEYCPPQTFQYILL
jgi:serine/threonine protein kinase